MNAPHFSVSTCDRIVDVSEVISVVREGFVSSEAEMIPKTYLNVPGGDFRAMPARYKNVAGIKWVSVFPENWKNNKLPSVIGTILLNDVSSGKLLATLDGTHITKIRTAAAAAVATDCLADKNASVASFIGCGQQTFHHIQYISAVRNINKIKLYDVEKQRAIYAKDAFEAMVPTEAEFVICESLSECISETDIITTLTPSTKPFIFADDLPEKVHINAMGADAKGKREIGRDVCSKIDLWVVDDSTQAKHSGETQYYRNAFRDGVFYSLKYILGLDDQKFDRTLFDSTGLAIQDIVVAKYVFDKFDPVNFSE